MRKWRGENAGTLEIADSNFIQNKKRVQRVYVFTEKVKKGQKYLYSFFMIQKVYMYLSKEYVWSPYLLLINVSRECYVWLGNKSAASEEVKRIGYTGRKRAR